MGRVREDSDSDSKLRLVKEICDISARANACTHSHHRNTKRSPFIDWYLLLKVEENAEIDIIRKQYRKLDLVYCEALQLHPDKNKHSKAEFAFKLLSQAFTCLTDDSKRRAFNLERWKRICNECNEDPYTFTHDPPTISNAAKLDRLSSKKILQGLKDIRARFKEETRVIENCLLRAKTESRKESLIYNPARKESPVFNPSDYEFQGYPHYRTSIYRKDDPNLWYQPTRNVLNFEHRRGKKSVVSPIFEIRSEKEPLKVRSSYHSSQSRKHCFRTNI